MEKKLDEITQRLKAAGGANLKSIVLYGSAVTGDFSAQHPDLNLICIVERAGSPELEALHEAAAWWVRQGQPAPLIFTIDELRRSADMFAIELLDIRASHRILYGPDVFEGFETPTSLHRFHVERELRSNWVRLRQAILTAPRRGGVVMGIMLDSVSSFATLFRHAFIAMGEPAPKTKRESIERAAALVGGNAAPFLQILDVKEGKRKPREIDFEVSLRGYLELVERFTNEIDRRFEAK